MLVVSTIWQNGTGYHQVWTCCQNWCNACWWWQWEQLVPAGAVKMVNGSLVLWSPIQLLPFYSNCSKPVNIGREIEKADCETWSAAAANLDCSIPNVYCCSIPNVYCCSIPNVGCCSILTICHLRQVRSLPEHVSGCVKSQPDALSVSEVKQTQCLSQKSKRRTVRQCLCQKSKRRTFSPSNVS